MFSGFFDEIFIPADSLQHPARYLKKIVNKKVYQIVVKNRTQYSGQETPCSDVYIFFS